MIVVGFVVFLAGLGLGYLAGRQLAWQDGSLDERVRSLASARGGGPGSSELERAEVDGAEELLTAAELIDRFGLYAQGRTIQERSPDPAGAESEP